MALTSITSTICLAAHNLGVLVDSSMHWGQNYGGPGNASDYYVLGGLQYKYHTDSFSPFVRVFAGAIRQVAPGYPFNIASTDQWNAALGAGGGIDYLVWHKAEGSPSLYLRVAQVDYIYSNYSTPNFGGSRQWNSARLSAGLVMGLGNYYTPTPTAACTAQPTEVTEGEPVTVTATGTNFNPKHTVGYAWTTNGGKLDKSDAQSARIDTTGVAAGSYTANATITDAKMKKRRIGNLRGELHREGEADESAAGKLLGQPGHGTGWQPVDALPRRRPAPDGAQITGITYTASAGNISGTGNTATLDTAGAAAGPITVTSTATDARNLTGSGTCTVNVEVPPPPPTCSKINSIQFPDLKRPWRVDNTAKAILDDVASRLKADPNAKIVIIGYADGEKAPMEGTGKNRHPMNLAAQRAVNAKAYLVQQQGIDPSRIEVRTGYRPAEGRGYRLGTAGCRRECVRRSAEHDAGG